MAYSLWKVTDGMSLEDIIRNAKDHIGHDWPTLARGFNMTKTEIDAIKSDNRDNLVEQIAQFFFLWQRQNGIKATTQAFVDCVMKELSDSELARNLKRSGQIARRGRSIMTASPTQSQSLVPIQESSPLASLIPIPESSPKAAAKLVRPPSCGTQESGDEDDAEVDYITESDGVKGKTDSVDDERKMRKIRNLKRLHHNKTGEGPFEEADMIRTKEGYGVVKCIFLEDAALKAGIELEIPVPSGGNGIYEAKRYFTCEDGHSLFVAYSALQADDRFGEIWREPEEDQMVDSKDIESPRTLDQILENLIPSLSEDSMCKFPGCKKPRFKESARKVHDYCGKTHSEAHSQLLQPSTGPCIHNFFIPQDRTGLLIGKCGKNILKIESSTSTIIQTNDSVGGKTNVTITGSRENCMKAALEIMECIEEKTAMHTATTKKIFMHGGVVGRVIGKNGVTIRYIKAETGVQAIDFDKPPKGVDICTCSITGSDEQIEEAIKLIKQVQNGEDIVNKAQFAAMCAKIGYQVKDDSETIHTPSADQCVIS